LNDVAALNIEIVAVILDKQKAKRPREPEDWYRLACSRALQHCLERYPKFEVTLDRRYTNPHLQGRLVDALMHGAVDLNHSVAIGYAMSQQEKAIQVADAVVWAIFQKYERGDESFYQIIRERIIVEEVLK